MKYYSKISQNPEIYLVNFPQKTDEIFFDVIFPAGKIFELRYNLKGAGHIFEHYVIGNFFEKNSQKSVDLNGFNSDESTGFYFESDQKDFLEILKNLLQEIFQTNFSNKNIFKRELLSVKNEILERKNILDNQFYEETTKKLFPRCALSLKIIERDDLDRINLEKIKLFHKKLLSVKPIFFIGGYKLSENFIKQFKTILENYKKEDYISINTDKCDLSTISFLEIKNPSIREGIYLSLNFPGLYEEKNNIEERLALNILKRIMTNDSKFGLYLKMREKGIFSTDIDNIMRPIIGIFSIQSFCLENQLLELLETTLDYLNGIKSNFIDKEIVDRISKDVKLNQKEAWNSNNRLYKWVINDIGGLGFIADKKIYSEILSKINPEYLNNLAKKIFDFGKINLTLIHGGKTILKNSKVYKILERR